MFILGAILLIVFIIPKKGRFKYEFEKEKPWLHDDLLAPFDFPIEKSPEEIELEREGIRENFKPYYLRDSQIVKDKLEAFADALHKNLEDEPEAVQKRREEILREGEKLLEEIYEQGVVENQVKNRNPPEFKLIVVDRQTRRARDRSLQELLSITEAGNYVSEQVEEDTLLKKQYFLNPLLSSITNNIYYDQQLSQATLQDLMENVSLTRGLVQENEKIISRGNIVTPEKYQILLSLKREYEQRISKGGNIEILLGYFILITLIFGLYTVYIHIFEPVVLKTNRNTILTLVNIIIFIIISIYVVQNPSLNIYVIPYCILPIVILAFFGSRAAFLSILLVVLIVGLIAPNAFEFILIQSLAGLTAVLSMLRIRYISQFFISTMLVFLCYLLTFFAINFVQGVEINAMPWDSYLWFGGNFILTLLAYPLIYAYEKAFGLVSDITLIELGDINRKLLRKLSLKAPGTFQHSLQVSNLAETLITELGGDALLTRVGALYHDIGKMENPGYFIENQKFMKNPHDYLDEAESARIIIRHVSMGDEMGKSYGLPEKIMEFIRTHHGTSRVEYFYQNYLRKNVGQETTDSGFRYPGPRPSTKEQAVVMIVDSVEAASRTLKQVEEGTIDKLVDKIIDNKIADHQLAEADLTLKEISHIRSRLKKLLSSLYHIRVEYPETDESKTPAEGL